MESVILVIIGCWMQDEMHVYVSRHVLSYYMLYILAVLCFVHVYHAVEKLGDTLQCI